jgi:hypothetical protein
MAGKIDERAGAGVARYPSKFGRGWIPVERDIGLPGEHIGALPDEQGPTGAASPLPLAGGAGGGFADSGDDALSGGEGPTPNPSRGREGLHASAANHDSWTPQRKAAFLHHLAEKGNVRAAAARVGLSHQSAYVARRRDRVFRVGWEAALVLAREAAAQVLATRALDGIEEPVWFRGENVGTRVRHDSRLLLAHLARLDKAAEETDAGTYAERFDELVALVAGEAVEDEMRDTGESWSDPDPLLPKTRERYADRRAQVAQIDARLQWEEDLRKRRATRADEPSDILTPWFDAALAEWDAWHARACAAVDAAVSAESLPPPRATLPKVEFDMAAFYAADLDEEDGEDDGEAVDAARERWDAAYSQDDVQIEYKSLELGLGPASARSSPARGGGARAARDAAVSPPEAGRAREGYTPPPPAAVPLPLQGRIVASSGHRQLRQPGVGWVMKKPPLGVPSEGLSVP